MKHSRWMTATVVALTAVALAGCNNGRDMSQPEEGTTNVQEAATSGAGAVQETDYSSLSREELVNKLNDTMTRLDTQIEALQERSEDEEASLREKLAQQRDKLQSAMDDVAEASDERLDTMQKNAAEQLEKAAQWLKKSAADDG